MFFTSLYLLVLAANLVSCRSNVPTPPNGNAGTKLLSAAEWKAKEADIADEEVLIAQQAAAIKRAEADIAQKKLKMQQAQQRLEEAKAKLGLLRERP